MARYNLYKNGSLVNTILAEEHFLLENPNLYDTYELIPEEPEVLPEPIQPVTIINDTFEPPDPGPITKVSPIEFKLLFLSTERILLKNSTDPIIQDFYDIIDDPRLTYVDLTLSTTIGALTYLVATGIISDRRKQQILNNETPTPDPVT